MSSTIQDFWSQVSPIFSAGLGWIGGSRLFPVKGQVQLIGGDSDPLVGHRIEVANLADPSMCSFGEIQVDGNFELEPLVHGQVRKGAPQGKYGVRLVLTGGDTRAQQRSAAAIHPRFLQFESSGLSFVVPPKDPVQFQVSRQ